jgi:hypothetical protein
MTGCSCSTTSATARVEPAAAVCRLPGSASRARALGLRAPARARACVERQHTPGEPARDPAAHPLRGGIHAYGVAQGRGLSRHSENDHAPLGPPRDPLGTASHRSSTSIGHNPCSVRSAVVRDPSRGGVCACFEPNTAPFDGASCAREVVRLNGSYADPQSAAYDLRNGTRPGDPKWGSCHSYTVHIPRLARDSAGKRLGRGSIQGQLAPAARHSWESVACCFGGCARVSGPSPMCVGVLAVGTNRI